MYIKAMQEMLEELIEELYLLESLELNSDPQVSSCIEELEITIYYLKEMIEIHGGPCTLDIVLGCVPLLKSRLQNRRIAPNLIILKKFRAVFSERVAIRLFSFKKLKHLSTALRCL